MYAFVLRFTRIAFLAAFLPGCGGSTGPSPVPVSGVITLDGKPLADAEVTFAAGDFAGFGKTNSEGEYELVQGALPGKNAVIISKWVGDKSKLLAGEGMDEEQMRAAIQAQAQDPNNRGSGIRMADLPHETLLPEYSDPAKSKLTFDVPESGTDAASFRLQSK